MLEVTERTKRKYSNIVMISLSDKDALRLLRFISSSRKSNFPAFPASKNLQTRQWHKMIL